MCNFALHYTPRARLTSPFIQCLPLEATFLHEFENSLNPGCCHDSLGLLMRKDSLIVWVYLIIQKGQHGTQPPPPAARGARRLPHSLWSSALWWPEVGRAAGCWGPYGSVWRRAVLTLSGAFSEDNVWTVITWRRVNATSEYFLWQQLDCSGL